MKIKYFLSICSVLLILVGFNNYAYASGHGKKDAPVVHDTPLFVPIEPMTFTVPEAGYMVQVQISLVAKDHAAQDLLNHIKPRIKNGLVESIYSYLHRFPNKGYHVDIANLKRYLLMYFKRRKADKYITDIVFDTLIDNKL